MLSDSVLSSRLLCRNSIFSAFSSAKQGGMPLRLLLDKSSLIRLLHNRMVLNSVSCNCVPAKMSSFKFSGSFMKWEICSSLTYARVRFILYNSPLYNQTIYTTLFTGMSNLMKSQLIYTHFSYRLQ
jgi:hypothetical protein